MPQIETLEAFEPSHDFFVGLDSDGCVFDSMEIKHKECFTPMFIKHWKLQSASKYARRAWEFSNLYSKTRERRGGVAMTQLNGNSCGECHMKVAPQVIINLKKGTSVEMCDSCRRAGPVCA